MNFHKHLYKKAITSFNKVITLYILHKKPPKLNMK